MSIDDHERTCLVPQGTRPSDGTAGVELRYPGSDGGPRYGSYAHACVIGRGEDCTVRLVAPEVSRRHAEIFPRDGAWWVRDLGSSNGTLVNGRPIARLRFVGTLTLELGQDGPRVRVTAPPPPPWPRRRPPLPSKTSPPLPRRRL